MIFWVTRTIFFLLSTKFVYRELNYHDQKIQRTLVRDIWKHWTAVSTLLSLISSVYCDLPHWGSNQRPQNNSIHNITLLLKKENIYLYPCPWGWDFLPARELDQLLCFVQWLFSGLLGIRAGRSMFNGRLEAERLLASAGLPSSRWAVSLTPLSPLSSTGPCCTV